MAHPLYYHARRLVGQSVYVHHVNGRVYHGTLISTNSRGIYVVQHPPGVRYASFESGGPSIRILSTQRTSVELDVEPVYAPASYFAFGALAGLTAGALMSPYWW